MKSSHFYASVAVAAVCLLLSLAVIIRGSSNQSLGLEMQKQQAKLQAQQESINAGQTISQQIGPNLLRDMAQVAVEDAPMKDLLSKHGYTVNVNATPAPGDKPAATTPAPATPAPR